MKKKISKNKIKRILKRAVLILVIAILGGIIGSFAVAGSSLIDRSPNPDNFIKTENYLVKDKDTNDKGIDVTVKKDGTIKLNGIASEDDEYVVASLSLDPGTYTISGMKSNKDSVGLKVIYGSKEYFAGTSEDTFTLATKTTVSVVIYVSEGTWNINRTIRPVLVEGTTAGEFYA